MEKLIKVTFLGYGDGRQSSPAFGGLFSPGETQAVEDTPEVHRVVSQSDGAYEIADSDAPVGINPKKVRSAKHAQKAYDDAKKASGSNRSQGGAHNPSQSPKKGAEADSAGGKGGEKEVDDPLASATKDELYQRATELEIDGRSTMNVEELRAAVRAADQGEGREG